MINLNHALHSSTTHSPLQLEQNQGQTQPLDTKTPGIGPGTDTASAGSADTLTLSGDAIALSQDPKANQQQASSTNLSKALSTYRQFSR